MHGELAINTISVSPKIWKRYDDDSFCIIKKDTVPAFHNTLKPVGPHISFTIEYENNGQITFLDTLVSRTNGNIDSSTQSVEPTKLSYRNNSRL